MNGWEGMLLGEAGGRYYISVYLMFFNLFRQGNCILIIKSIGLTASRSRLQRSMGFDKTLTPPPVPLTPIKLTGKRK